MKEREIKAKIKRAYTLAVPNVRESVLSSAEKGKEVIIMTNKTKKTAMWKKLTAYASVAAVFVFAVLGGIYYGNNFIPESVVSIDVNPSVEIKLAKSERVIDVIAHNKDGETIIEGMDFKGADLDITVNALIGSMLRHGYLNELANSILVSVEGDADRSADLRDRLAEKIDEILTSEKFGGSVLSQTLSKDSDAEKLAEKHGISVGKVQLINDIITVSPVYSFAELAELSINELNILAGKTGTDLLDHVNFTGSASEDSYIGYDVAKDVAMNHAGVKSEDVRNYEAELDYEKGKMVYEIEFDALGNEYEYEINAVTGEIVKSEKEADDDYVGGDHTPPPATDTTPDKPADTTYIEREAALTAVYAHAGVNEADVKNLEVKLDRENGKAVYEIEFDALGYEYDYDVDAVTGTIVKSEKDVDDDWQETAPPAVDAPADPTYITRDAALDIVYAHAGVNAADVRNLKAELDTDDGVVSYEIEFDANGFEYDYDVNAVTGTIIKSEKETDDDYKQTAPPATDTPAPSYITRDEALAAAYKHAGVNAADVKNLKVELDTDDGVASYEIEFDANGFEYDYDIDAVTGAIIKSEKDVDDDWQSAPPKTDTPADTTPAGSEYIGREKALSIAYAHAGIKSSAAKEVEVELDRAHGTYVYEIEFKANGYEYEYEINAVTGTIIFAEKDIDD